MRTPAKSSAQVNKAIRHTGLNLTYTRGDGYFYFLNDDGYKLETVYVFQLNNGWKRQNQDLWDLSLIKKPDEIDPI